MRWRIERALVLTLTLALASGCGPGPAGGPPPLRLAVAANVAPTARALAEAWTARGGGTVQVSAASSGALYAQLRQDAPFDLFLAADSAYPARLAQERGFPERPFHYADGRLALAWRPNAPGDTLWTEALDRAASVALANPRHAPYGRAADAVLAARGLAPRRLTAENAGQVPALFAAGGADAAFLAWSTWRTRPEGALSDAVARPLPADRYPPLRQFGLVTGTHPEAKAFAAWLRGPEARARWAADGYGLPGR